MIILEYLTWDSSHSVIIITKSLCGFRDKLSLAQHK